MAPTEWWLECINTLRYTTMNATASGRRFALSPWPLLLVQVGWLWAAVSFAYFAVIWRSASHVGMAVASVLLIAGISLRSRVAFWVSTFAFAAAVGGTVARIIKLESAPPPLAASLAIGVVAVLLHQTPAGFSWFTFQNSRRHRLRFWLLVAIVCVVTEFAYVILLRRAA